MPRRQVRRGRSGASPRPAPRTPSESMSDTTEAFARVKIDVLLRNADQDLSDGLRVLFKHALPDGTQADYVPCDPTGPAHGDAGSEPCTRRSHRVQDQGKHYAEQLAASCVFLVKRRRGPVLGSGNGRPCTRDRGALCPGPPRTTCRGTQGPSGPRHYRDRPKAAVVEGGGEIVDRDHEIECLETLSSQVALGRPRHRLEQGSRCRTDKHVSERPPSY